MSGSSGLKHQHSPRSGRLVGSGRDAQAAGPGHRQHGDQTPPSRQINGEKFEAKNSRAPRFFWGLSLLLKQLMIKIQKSKKCYLVDCKIRFQELVKLQLGKSTNNEISC
ncbi:hypothetical protein ElyMa_004331500 [Elysia marginata]|uniref:Uncharacterized protein n=1 Tax=Elysia marginata TaxID=1093978 RepID=A0AAV4H127_9GAST|nr:hypothetical protein ElyMa_004331500 [Elysia marginata]